MYLLELLTNISFAIPLKSQLEGFKLEIFLKNQGCVPGLLVRGKNRSGQIVQSKNKVNISYLPTKEYTNLGEKQSSKAAMCRTFQEHCFKGNSICLDG